MQFAIVLNMDRLSDDVPMTVVWDRVLEMVNMAEEGGFDIAWTGEHHTIEVTIAPNPFQVLSHWAAITKRIRLGTGVLSAPYWHPLRLAGEAALCDLISSGRLELGIGRGAYQYEFDRMKPGTRQQEGVAYMKEIIAAVRELWKGDYAHEGHYWQFPTATSVPKPLQMPHPRLWCAARDPGSFDWAVANGMNIMATPLHGPHAEVENLVRRFEQTLEKKTHVLRPQLMMLRRTCVYERESEWETPVRSLTNYGCYFENLMKNIGSVTNGFAEPVSFETVANKTDYDRAALRENMMFGTPDEVVVKLERYDALGIDIFLYGAFFGMPYEFAKRSLKLFIDEVMPRFRQRRVAALQQGGRPTLHKEQHA
jgi:alkanesulfonate monooxygenase SsuD/methylene tetrahydromethanopterin reductase-like flavin-dependent oxidoreductase (luciferase family)